MESPSAEEEKKTVDKQAEALPEFEEVKIGGHRVPHKTIFSSKAYQRGWVSMQENIKKSRTSCFAPKSKPPKLSPILLNIQISMKHSQIEDSPAANASLDAADADNQQKPPSPLEKLFLDRHTYSEFKQLHSQMKYTEIVPQRVDLKNKKILLIAKSKGKLKKFNKLKEALDGSGLVFDIKVTARARHAYEMVRTFEADKYDSVFAYGGDGTLNEFVNGFMHRADSCKIPVGFLPGGTGNDFMATLGIKTIRQALDCASRGKVQMIDVGRAEIDVPEGVSETTANDTDKANHFKYFVGQLGVGITADASIKGAKLKSTFGKFAYTLAGALCIVKNPVYVISLKLDDVVIFSEKKVNMIQIHNTQYAGGGMLFTPFAVMNDGLFDILVVSVKGRRKVYKMFDALKKKGRHVLDPDVHYYRASKVEIDIHTPCYIHVDGEVFPAQKKLVINCLPSKLDLLYDEAVLGNSV